MSIEKKSLISALKTTKEVKVAPPATNEGSTSRKLIVKKINANRMRRMAKAR